MAVWKCRCKSVAPYIYKPLMCSTLPCVNVDYVTTVERDKLRSISIILLLNADIDYNKWIPLIE